MAENQINFQNINFQTCTNFIILQAAETKFTGDVPYATIKYPAASNRVSNVQRNRAVFGPRGISMPIKN